MVSDGLFCKSGARVFWGQGEHHIVVAKWRLGANQGNDEIDLHTLEKIQEFLEASHIINHREWVAGRE
jgi:hypothetical protein